MKFLTIDEGIMSVNTNLSPNNEETIRNQMVTWISFYCLLLNGKRKIIARAIYMFQKYCKVVPYVNFDKYEMAAACVFLSLKLEEHPQRVRKCASVYLYIRQNEKKIHLEEPFVGKTGQRNEKLWQLILSSCPKKSEVSKTANRILECEIRLLNTIGFDFDYENPYKYVLIFFHKWDESKEEFRIIAEKFVNDSYRTEVCLMFPSQVIALSCI